MTDLMSLILGNVLMAYAALHLAAAWAWGSKRGVPVLLLTVFGVAIPVGAWALSIAKPPVLWAAPVSIVVLYLLAIKPHRELLEAIKNERVADRAAAEDRAISRPDDGAARMTLARVAESEGLFDDALDHYEAAHRASELMFSAADLAAARDNLDTLRAVAERKRGLLVHPIDMAAVAASAVLCFFSPARGAAPLSGLLFVLWMRGDLGEE